MPQSRDRMSAPAWTWARSLATAVALTATLFVPALAAATAPLRAVIHHVDNAATGANDGTSWTDAFADLQSALDAAVAGDEIWVAASATPYTPTATIDGAANPRLASFVLKSGVAIYGGFAGDERLLRKRALVPGSTVLSGDVGIAGDDTDNSYHVVYADGVTDAVLDGFTVTGGRSNHSGGGLYSDESVLTVSGCVFSDNSARSTGGGLYSQHSTLTVSDCIFDNNRAGEAVYTGAWTRGGGMAIEGSYPGSYEASVITGCTFRDNQAAKGWNCILGVCGGAGLYSHETSLLVDRSSFEDNWAQGSYSSGGAVLSNASWAVFTSSIFTGNSASHYGGAMANFGASFVFNCTFYRNGARPLKDGKLLLTGLGGAIYQVGSSRIYSSLFSGNIATHAGGAILADRLRPRDLVVSKSLFHENYAACEYKNTDCELRHLGHSPAQFPPEVDGLLLDVDPLLADPEHGDFHLLAGSPAIDAGWSRADLRVTPTPFFPATDVDGDKRFVDGGGLAGAASDIGADEHVPTLQDLGAVIQGQAEAGQLDADLLALARVYVADVQTALDDGDLDAASFILDEMIAWLQSLDASEATQRMLRMAEAVRDSVG